MSSAAPVLSLVGVLLVFAGGVFVGDPDLPTSVGLFWVAAGACVCFVSALVVDIAVQDGDEA